MHSGGPGHGASVQQPLCAQGPGHSQLPGQRAETGEGVGPRAQQGCIQQVEGHRWGGARGRGQMYFRGVWGGASHPSSLQRCSRLPRQWANRSLMLINSLVLKN